MTVADSLNLMILKDTEQRDLCFRRQIANLVEEDRAAIGGLEPAEAPLQRARERALLVAEELGGDERRGDRRTAHANEGATRSMRFRVDGPCDQLFAATGCTADEHVRIRLRQCHYDRE